MAPARYSMTSPSCKKLSGTGAPRFQYCSGTSSKTTTAAVSAARVGTPIPIAMAKATATATVLQHNQWLWAGALTAPICAQYNSPERGQIHPRTQRSALKRFLQHHLETRIGRAILTGEVRDGAVVEVGVENGELAVEIRQAELAQPVEAAN